ncbi:hypothetical protein AB5I41_28905 [Sphingomonas sp. MMS24-JH45]
MTEEDEEVLLEAARQFVGMDDDWRFDLKAAMGWTDSNERS